MHKSYTTKPNGTLIAIAFIFLFIIIAYLCVNSLNSIESNKFVGAWSNNDTIWIFESDGTLIRNYNTIKEEGTYSIEKGHLVIMDNSSALPLLSVNNNEYVYYFSSNHNVLELHYIVGDGFITLQRISD